MSGGERVARVSGGLEANIVGRHGPITTRVATLEPSAHGSIWILEALDSSIVPAVIASAVNAEHIDDVPRLTEHGFEDHQWGEIERLMRRVRLVKDWLCLRCRHLRIVHDGASSSVAEVEVFPVRSNQAVGRSAFGIPGAPKAVHVSAPSMMEPFVTTRSMVCLSSW
ncbi:MAG: hypothetical protein ACJAYU_000271 [Bradymonadia bacterium]